MLAVRRLPSLRGAGKSSPSAARRAASSAEKRAKFTRGPAQSGRISELEDFDPIIACGFKSNTALKVVQIDIGVKGKELPGLIEPVLRRAGGKLPHAISDQIFHGDHGKSSAFGNIIDQDYVITINFAVERRRTDNFETEFQIRMDKAARQLPGPRWLDEAVTLKFSFEFALQRRADVEIAGHERAR